MISVLTAVYITQVLPFHPMKKSLITDVGTLSFFPTGFNMGIFSFLYFLIKQLTIHTIAGQDTLPQAD